MSFALELQSFPVIFCVTFLLAVFTYLWFVSAGKVKNLESKYILITGCDSGFGRDTAKKLDSMGLNVFATCFTQDGEKRLKEECSSKLTTVRLDITDSKQVKEAYEFVKERLPQDAGLWGLVNNAGKTVFGPIEWVSLADFRSTADVNLWGMLDMSKTFLPLLKQTRGRIVNIVSMMGRVTVPQSATYAISKHGAEALTNALRLELRDWGIKVSMIEPGFFRTGMTSNEATVKRIQEAWDKLDPQMKEDYGEKYLELSKETWKSMVAWSTPKTDEVVNSITDALLSTNPKIRYVAGYDAKFLWRQVTMLPDTFHDFLFRIFTGPPTPYCVGKYS